jgi:hypothetical protein
LNEDGEPGTPSTAAWTGLAILAAVVITVAAVASSRRRRASHPA